MGKATPIALAFTASFASSCGRIGFDALNGDALLGYRATVLADLPSSYWRLDETTGMVAADQTGAQPGSYHGDTLGAAGAIADGDLAVIGSATIGSHVATSDIYEFTGTAPFTLEVWIKPASYSATAQNFLFAKEGPLVDPGVPYQGYSLAVGTQLAFRRYTNGVFDNCATANPPIGEWSYVVATYDGATMSLYVNAALIAQQASSRAINGAPGTTFTISARSLGGSAFDGVIDEPAVYSHALTATEVARHYAAASRS